jgi:tetratricopeptide (TPR) repeat protein
MFRLTGIVVFSFFGLLMASTSAMAQSAPTARTLIQAGAYDDARAVLIARDASGLERAYFEGIILHEQEKYVEAVALFRQILQARPEQILVRQALVRSLLEINDYEAAEYHLEQLTNIDENSQNIERYRAAQQRILRDKPYGITGSFSLVPSTNINRGTTNSVFSTGLGDFIIVEEGKETAGTTVNASVSGFRRFELNGDDTLTLNAGLSAAQSLEGENPAFEFRLSSDFRRPTDTGYWELSPGYSLSWLEGEKSYYTLGLDYTLRRRTSRENIWTYEISASQSTFFVDEFRNGLNLQGSVNLRHIISPSLSVTGEFAYGVGLPERDDLKYQDVSVSVDVLKSWSNGWRTSVGLELDFRAFADNFTSVDFPREDFGRTLRASFSNTNISFAGLSPSLGCTVKDVESTIAFYEYTVTECGIGMSRRF